MSENQVLLREAPYEFVPLLEQCKRKACSSHAVEVKDTCTGRLELKIHVESMLHIGSMQQDYDQNGNVIKKQMRRNGKIIIPGSSLKGSVRSIAEAVSHSCAVKVPNGWENLKCLLPVQNRESCSNPKRLCITCSMFGMAKNAAGYKGKLQFGEFVLEQGGVVRKKLPPLKSPFRDYPECIKGKKGDQELKKLPDYDVRKILQMKSGYGNERLYYCRACETENCQNCTKYDYFQAVKAAGPKRNKGFRGRKFYSTAREDNREEDSRFGEYFEMIKPGSILKGELWFQNLEEEEGKLLAYALNLGRHFTLKLGYGKPLGCGKIWIELAGIDDMGDRYSKEKKLKKEEVEKWAQEYRESCPADIKEVIREFERIME